MGLERPSVLMILDDSRPRAYCACSRCGWGLFGYFYIDSIPPLSSAGMGCSGGAMVMGKLPVLGHLLIWMIVGQGPIVRAVGVSGGLFGYFYTIFSLLFLPVFERQPNID